jgi:hypothetical protein
VLAHRGRELAFVALGDGDRVAVKFDSEGAHEHRLYREPALADRWVWARIRRGTTVEERLPLFDAGLEELAVRGLGLPRPPGDDRPMALRTAAALTRPAEPVDEIPERPRLVEAAGDLEATDPGRRPKPRRL